MPLMYENTSDEDLLIASLHDANAFGVFYERYADAITAFFGARTRQADVAADLTAETFAAALIALKNYRADRAPAYAWLFGIARHKLADSYRRGRVESEARQRLKLEPLVLQDADLERVDDLAEIAAGPDVAALLGHLPSEQRQAVVARILDEATYPKIARQLGCSEAVVRQRVSRGLRTLRRRMENAR